MSCELSEKLKEIRNEDIIWLFYIGIIILSWISNSYERRYFIYGLKKDKKKYQDLIIFVFSILLIFYYYFFKSSYDSYNKLSVFDSIKKRRLTFLSLVGSLFVLISGLIFLYIAISDEDIDIEIAFN